MRLTLGSHGGSSWSYCSPISPAGAKEAHSRAVEAASKATEAPDCASVPLWKASLAPRLYIYQTISPRLWL
jgi:hypothetical protein